MLPRYGRLKFQAFWLFLAQQNGRASLKLFLGHFEHKEVSVSGKYRISSTQKVKNEVLNIPWCLEIIGRNHIFDKFLPFLRPNISHGPHFYMYQLRFSDK